MNDEAEPIYLNVVRWEELPDGRQQLLIECSTVHEYTQQPKVLMFEDEPCRKVGWDSEQKVTVYRFGEPEDLIDRDRCGGLCGNPDCDRDVEGRP